jgi:hypothetical protein
MPFIGVTRRSVLIGAAAAVALTLAPTPAKADGGAADPYRRRYEDLRKRIRPGSHSANGWAIETAADEGGSIWTKAVPGTGVEVAIADGVPAALIGYLLQRFHYDVRPLTQADVLGFKKPHRGLRASETNHASGTAVDIYSAQLVRGRSDGYFPQEVRAIRTILRDLEGAIVWGGDFRQPDQSHFEIAAGPGDERLAALAQRLAGTSGLRP